MQQKRNGKVEHSDNSHDDQVFSYLMAMYVWYEGKELKERYNIDKSAIKTDKDIDEVVTGLEEKYSQISKEIEYIQGSDEPINKDINKLKSGSGISYQDFVKKERKKEDQLLQLMLQNRVLKQTIADTMHITPDQVDAMYGNNKTIPDSILMGFNDYDTDGDTIEDMVKLLNMKDPNNRLEEKNNGAFDYR